MNLPARQTVGSQHVTPSVISFRNLPVSLQIGRKIAITFTEKEKFRLTLQVRCNLRSGDPFSPSSPGSEGKRMLPEMTGTGGSHKLVSAAISMCMSIVTSQQSEACDEQNFRKWRCYCFSCEHFELIFFRE